MPSRSWSEADIPDLSGRVAVVTGANSGIGFETARALAARGARVVLACRDPNKGHEAELRVRAALPEARVRFLRLDLGSLASVEGFCRELAGAERKLDLLCNNAGVMMTPLSRTADGFELQLGTNHLGHFALAQLLRPALEAGAPARVVSVSSTGHRRSDIHWDDPNYRERPYDKWEAYGQSKTANALFAVGLSKRWGERGIHANAVHPGGIMTGLQKHLPREEMQAMGWFDAEGKVHALFKTPEQGAATSVWAAVGPELDGVGLIAALRRQGRAMPILLLSGYPANTLSQLDEEARAGVITMQKPVEPPLLIETARRLLTRH